MDKKASLFEPQASFEAFPFFDLHKWEPEGQRMWSPSFAYIFLAKQEK
jgi:hypothetical protein